MSVLRVAYQYHPNPQALTIHVNRKMPLIYQYSESGGEEGEKLRKMLAQIDGVDAPAISTGTYSITIHRGRVYQWDALIEEIMPILLEYFGLERTETVQQSDTGESE